jgi:hypothetical protein
MRAFVLWGGWMVAILATVTTGELIIGIVGTAAELLLIDSLNFASSLGVGSARLTR